SLHTVRMSPSSGHWDHLLESSIITHTTSTNPTLACPAVSFVRYAADFSGKRLLFSRQSFRISRVFSALRPCLCNGITFLLVHPGIKPASPRKLPSLI